MTVDDIARLLEDRLDEISRACVVTHIRACRQCHRLFQDSAVELGMLECGGLLTENERDDLVDAGVQVIGSGRGIERGHDDVGDSVRRTRRRPLVRGASRALALAAAAVVIAWGAWFAVRSFNRSPSVDPEVLRTIEVAVGAYSGSNDFVLPGGERFLATDAPVYRSIRGPKLTIPDESLESAIKVLHDQFEDGDESPDVAYWLVAGYLSTDRIGAARSYIGGARGLFPDDPRLMVLDAALEYEHGSLDQSESLLRSALAVRPDDPVILFDLAVVLADQDKSAKAGELLTAIRDHHPDTPIADRAAALLKKLP